MAFIKKTMTPAAAAVPISFADQPGGLTTANAPRAGYNEMARQR